MLLILCDLYLNIFWNVEIKAIIPPKMNKIADISVRHFRKIVFTQKPNTFTFFNIFPGNYQDRRKIEFRT